VVTDPAEEVLYVVADDADTYVVALDEPALARSAQRVNHDGIVHLSVHRPLSGARPQEPAVREDPAGLPMIRGAVVAASVLIGIGALAGAALLSPWVFVPIGAAGITVLVARFEAYAKTRKRMWPDRYRMIKRRTEAKLFRRSTTAVQAITNAWPHLRGLVQIDSPRRELAGSLWVLADLLQTNANLRTEWGNLDQARRDLPPHAVVQDEIADRIARIRAALSELWVDINHRIAALESLAKECSALARDERALANAYAAIRRADDHLGRVVPAGLALPDGGRELNDRVTSIVVAYRELAGLEWPGAVSR
jgi:hypothetical protein